MAELVSTTTECALQTAGRVVYRQVGHFFNYNDKFKEVKDFIGKLDGARERVQREVDCAEMNAEEIYDDVKRWIKQVDEKIKKYESFVNDESHAKTGCSIGFFPKNLQLRYRLGRKATKMVEEIQAENLCDKKFDKVSYRLLPSIDAALTNIGYESFASRTTTMEIIMQALEDSTVNLLGVYGVGGVGKTTLVKEVVKKVQEKKLFNMVAMANITRNPNVKKIQRQIAEMLGMELVEESEIVRADRIRKRLKKEKENTLIILDDIWDRLDLNSLGIPCVDDDDDGSQRDVKDVSDFDYGKMEKDKLSVDHKGCKILLISRTKEVLCNQMDVQERSTFPLEVLENKEAETLLKKVAGIHGTNSMFDGKANEIAQMYAGLPIALVSIGRALKNKNSAVWEDVCQQIKKQSFTEGRESIEFSVKLSYDHLKNELLKTIFLHCARMGNDALIMDLMKFCIGMGFLSGVQTIREARKKVNVLIEGLKESSLLVGSYSFDRFNMHDIVRDAALSISSKEKHVLFKKNDVLDEWPHKDELERYTAIFLHFCDINDGLPESIYCPRLEVLHIDSKDDFLKISDDFFKDMIELRVLILTGVDLSCLPSSIKCLRKLRMLSLERCTLGKNLSIIGELKKLRILTLSGSNIESLPLEFGQLEMLQLFDLSNCSKLRVIPSNIISRMNILEEFYMRDSLILWEAEENIQSENASLSELRHLNQLGNLDIHIQSVAHFPRNLFFDMLGGYKIVVGDFKMLPVEEFKIPDKHEMAKFLALNLEDGIDIHSEKWIKMLFKGVEYLLLRELNDVHDVAYELNVEGFPNLKHLSIVNNFSIQYIIKSMELAFPKLESMFLYKLENLKIICGSQLTEASFCNLKIIKIKACDQLEYLFPYTIVRLLTILETIEVCDCDSLKEIVFVERHTHTITDDKIVFPQLQLLTLQSLPAFTSLYTNDKIPSCAQSLSLENQVPNMNIDASISLFNEKVVIPKLERLELSSINIQKIWSDQSLHCFQNLLTLNVTDCGNLKYLLSSSMAGSLVNLQSLSVNACEMMEDIFCPKDAEDDLENVDVFPKLKTMEIVCMEKLNTIWQPHVDLRSFHCLNSLIIRKCHKLVTIFPSYMWQTFQSLQSLTITDCKLVENIFDFGNIPQTCERNETNLHDVVLEKLPNLVYIWRENTSEILKYKNLQSIMVYGCPSLKYLFPLSVANDLEKLENLQVWGCEVVEEIVAWDQGSNENAITFKFPHLKSVALHNLFELGSFYRGTHTLEWPSLQKLLIVNCCKLEGFSTEIKNSQVKPIVLATEKVINNLECIATSLKEAEWLQKYIVSVHRMHKLQTLILNELKNTKILFWLLHRLANLKRLRLVLGHMKRIWGPGRLNSHERIGVVMQLKHLELISMINLEEIGFEHEQLLQRVESLVISGCRKLKNIASSSVSFSYLTLLEVKNCRLMRNLMTCSTAKSLSQLKTMKVSSCPMIVEIVAENEEEKVEEIEFRKLKSLELVSLQSLKSFCSSEMCELKLPLLENLVVSECPKMAKFSKLGIAPPNLKKLHVVDGEKDKWYWEGDLNVTLQTRFANQVSLKYCKQVRLIDYPKMNGVRHGKPAFPDNLFGSLKKLEFDGASKREIVIPSNVLAYLKTLEELNVQYCHAAQVIFDIDDSEIKTKGIVIPLKKLTLKYLSDLKHVWNKNPQGIVSFPYLEHVSVNHCGSLATLFPSSIATNLGKLKTLQIWLGCDELVEIVGKEDALMEDGTNEILFDFPCLSHLVLFNLSLLSCFYPGKHHLECPLLECLHVSFCPGLKLFTSEFNVSQKEQVIEEGQVSAPIQQPLFSVDKVVPKLKELTVNEENIMLLSDAHLPQDILLCKLKSIKLCYEDENNEKDTLPFDFLQRIPNLEQLSVNGCYGLKEIFPSQKLQVHEGIPKGLKQLILFNIKDMKSIGLEHQWVKPYSEKLQSLNVFSCHKLEKLVDGASVSFINLKVLVVRDCRRMECLFTFSTAKSLVQLESLDIKDCGSIKEIVKKENEDDSHKIIFGRLRTITLSSLPILVSFYSGNATLQFSRLREAKIVKCPKMKTFSGGAINTPLFLGIQPSEEDWDLHFRHDLNTTIQMLFFGQDFFEYSKHLILVDCLEMTRVWHVNPAISDNFFGSFKKLKFDGACKRDIVIPYHVLAYLKCLEELNVHGCDAAQVIFGIDDANEASIKGIIVFPLKILTLKALPNLKCEWNKDPRGIVSFPNLQELSANDCGCLVTLFPSSIAGNLGKLRTLQIESCDKLVQIVGKEDTLMELGTTQILFEFPRFSKLLLNKVPVLSCFYPGKHHLECPLLKNLWVSCCPKLKLFTSEFHGRNKEEDIEGPISLLQQPMFLVEKVVPKLEWLALNEENIMLLSDAHLPRDLLCSLRVLLLYFEDDNNEKDTLPFDFLHKVPSLEHLLVNKCYGLKEIFPSQKLHVHDGTLAALKQLTLSDLKELESIGLEHQWAKPYSAKLQTLKISGCIQLEKLASCAVSFINLKQLVVSACHRMEYLFTFSTAKSLELLERLDINNCESIKEIVKKEDEHDSHMITFGRLTTLTLYDLPILVRFYSGNATLQFSCLETATVAKCPIMETFSERGINAPIFFGIKTSMEDSQDLTFHGDLNMTIQRLFHQQVEKSAYHIQHLKFGDHPHLEEIWLGVIPIPSDNSFNNLKSLILDKCESLSRVIPFYLLRFLCNLQEIQVRNCQSVEAIFDSKDIGEDMKPDSQLSLPLKKLVLNNLPNLEHIWNLNPDEILSFQNLQEVYISNCQSLKILFSTSVANHLVMLDVRYCASLVEIFVEDEAALKGETKQFIFHCLTSLTLWELPELKYFYPGKNLLEWPRLTHLDIYHCDKLKLFTTNHHSEVADVEDQLAISIDQQAIFSVEKVFPNLMQLSLKKDDMAILQGHFQVMPSLDHQEITEEDTMLGQGQFGANAAHLLQNLEVLKLMCYHEDDESNIFSSRLLEEIPSIENLEVVCSSFNEIFSSERPDCTKVLPKLKILHLNNLQQLNSIGLEHSWVEPLLKTLETLKVFSCPCLKTLVPSTVSFSNLTSLSVNECHGLVYLFTFSTAKSLGQLKNMSIQNCKAIQEIVSKEGDQESNDEEITFGQLSVLSLESLPSIAGIYSGSSKLKFPSLDQVTLMECPQMQYSYVADLHEFKPHEQI